MNNYIEVVTSQSSRTGVILLNVVSYDTRSSEGVPPVWVVVSVFKVWSTEQSLFGLKFQNISKENIKIVLKAFIETKPEIKKI